MFIYAYCCTVYSALRLLIVRPYKELSTHCLILERVVYSILDLEEILPSRVVCLLLGIWQLLSQVFYVCL